MAELNQFTTENKDKDMDSDHESNECLQPENSSPQSISNNFPLILEQVRVVDMDGNLKVLYPSKTDLGTVSSVMSVIH